jgi:hypothetical protein
MQDAPKVEIPTRTKMADIEKVNQEFVSTNSHDKDADIAGECEIEECENLLSKRS